jgi:hypothetical protein
LSRLALTHYVFGINKEIYRMSKDKPSPIKAELSASLIPIAPQGFRLLKPKDRTQIGDYFYAHGHWHPVFKTGVEIDDRSTPHCRPSG